MSNLWIVLLVMGNLNWIVTSVIKTLCFCYHVYFLMAYNYQSKTRFETWTFFVLWVLFHFVHMYLAYAFDKTNKLNFDYVMTLKNVSNLE